MSNSYPKIHILGGGTFNHVRNHLSLATPAFGTTAKQLFEKIEVITDGYTEHDYDVPDELNYLVNIHLTKMASNESRLVTNEDVSLLVDKLIEDPTTKVIIFNVALCDFVGNIIDNDGNVTESGKYATRLHSREQSPTMQLEQSDKILKKIRQTRKDIFLVAFKTTCNATEDEQYIAALNLLKENSVNLVLANDTGNRRNMIVCPEEARYCVTTDRNTALDTLAEMTMSRCRLHYTRSTVIPGDSIDWNSPEVPDSLRTVVNHCISKGAYKPFRGSTAGHFAVKVDDKTFLTSKRSTNFNELSKIGLVKVESTGKDNVVAYGAKPSVGGMSQRIIFTEHEDVDCIVHFHCPIKEDSVGMSVALQWPYECGSHECGQNTSDHLTDKDNLGIKSVYLEEHGPNIVFNRNIDPNLVIDFIDKHFDLSQKTGGSVYSVN
jgi:hypothetical protein